MVAGTATAILPDGDMSLAERISARTAQELMLTEQQRQAILQQQQRR
jgi:hypothetical protein